MCRCKCAWWMVLKLDEKCLRTVHSSQHQHQEDLRLHVHGEDGLLSGSAM